MLRAKSAVFTAALEFVVSAALWPSAVPVDASPGAAEFFVAALTVLAAFGFCELFELFAEGLFEAPPPVCEISPLKLICEVAGPAAF